MSAAYLGRLGGPPWRPPASRCRPRGCPLGAGAGSHRRLGNSAAASTTLPAPARPPPAGPADVGEQLPPPPFQQPQQEEEEISERELCEDDLLAEEQLLRLQQGSEAHTATAQGYAPAVWAGEEHAQCKAAPGPPAAEEEIESSDPNVSYADLLAQEQRLRREAEARTAAAERKQAAAEREIARLRRQLAASRQPACPPPRSGASCSYCGSTTSGGWVAEVCNGSERGLPCNARVQQRCSTKCFALLPAASAPSRSWRRPACPSTSPLAAASGAPSPRQRHRQAPQQLQHRCGECTEWVPAGLAGRP